MAVALYKTRGGTVPASGEIAVLAELVRTHGRATLIVPSLAERKLCRRALANAGCGLAVEVTTPTAWIASLWELMGDGRALVGTKARKLLAAQVLADASEGASRSSGVGDASAAAFEDEDMAPHAERGRAGAAAHSAPTPHAGREELRETRGMVEMLARAARDLLPALQDKASGAQLTAVGGDPACNRFSSGGGARMCPGGRRAGHRRVSAPPILPAHRGGGGGRGRDPR